MTSNDKSTAWVVTVILAVIAGVVGGGFWGYPQYSVYQQRMSGEAMLQKAESERRVQVEDAKGKEQAAKMLANAEIERARGVAEANKIIGDSLKNNPDYLTWLWIEKINENGNSVIYVPTEAGIPILEAGRGFRRTGVEKK